MLLHYCAMCTAAACNGSEGRLSSSRTHGSTDGLIAGLGGSWVLWIALCWLLAGFTWHPLGVWPRDPWLA